jgi:hypothetical protein
VVVPPGQGSLENDVDEAEEVFLVNLAAADEPDIHLMGLTAVEPIHTVATVHDARGHEDPIVRRRRPHAERAGDDSRHLGAEDVIWGGVAGVAAVSCGPVLGVVQPVVVVLQRHDPRAAMDFSSDAISGFESGDDLLHQKVDGVETLRFIREVRKRECLSELLRGQDANPRSDMDHLTFRARP